MRNKEISKIVLKITDGVMSSLVDLVLWNIFYFAEIGPLGNPTNLRRAESGALRQLEKFNSSTIKRAIYKARSRGLIKKDSTLTTEGKKRLEKFFPSYLEKKKKWNGDWYLVSYDIPEERRHHRNILRENLKQLGFGEMHASLWVSPFNYLGNVEEIVDDYNLSSFVILAVSNRVGEEESKVFANKIWKLDQINMKYKNLIEEVREKSPERLFFEYLFVLKQDPQLSPELLPEDWYGDKAYLIFKNCFPNFKNFKRKI